MPIEVADLAWYGVDPKVIKQLEPFVQLIPFSGNTPLASTATDQRQHGAGGSADGRRHAPVSRAQAQQLIMQRHQKPFRTPESHHGGAGHFGRPARAAQGLAPDILAFKSQYFEIYGQLRYEQHVIRERSVVYRKDHSTPCRCCAANAFRPTPT